MKNSLIHLSSKVTRISEIDKRYMELEMFISDTEPNLNSVVTTKEFLESKSDTLVGMPLVVDRQTLESGFTNSLTHRYENGQLNTDVIGVFQEVWLEYNVDNPDYVAMKGRAIVYKRFPNTIAQLKELYEEEDLKFSWELLATEVEEKDNGISYITDGSFEANCVVSNPAYGDKTRASKMVAEAFAKDVSSTQMSEQNKEGGESIDMKKQKLEEFLAEVLTEKSIDDVRAEIREAIIATVDAEQYGIYIYDMYPSQVIYEQYDRDTWVSEYFRVSYTISENSISVNTESKSEVVRVWMDKSDLDAQENPMLSQGEDRKVSEKEKELSEKTEEVETLSTKLSELEEKLQSQEETEVPEVELEEGETEIAETETEVPEVEAEPNEKDVELAEKVIALSERVETLEEENKVLKPYRDQVLAEEAEKEELEKEANKTRLSEMVKKFIAEDEEIPEEVQTMISEMDENKIKLWIAEKAIIEVRLTSEVEGEDDKPIVVGTSGDDQLVKEKDEEMEMY